MKFKTDREKNEFNDLCAKNPKLSNIVLCADIFARLNFGKEITLTHVLRTMEEHVALYSQTPPDKRPATSPHMRHEAVDLRSRDFTAEEIRRLVDFLNMFTVYGGQRRCAMHHAIAGNVNHFHIQSDKG